MPLGRTFLIECDYSLLSLQLSIIMGSINLVLLVAAVIHIHEVICETCARCSKGWWHFHETDSCYLRVAFKNVITYHEAENHCMKQGGHLASIHSQHEDYFIGGSVSAVKLTMPTSSQCGSFAVGDE
ncbi:hypothetical protein Tcan_16377 [Toxocara canis]|uniref:C-type lectin domain-containing protein n=1 Tax=Toxocara canis TaxID=6265 RepID=A0A0B2UT89_TOXCA|nr:hypothetical protein Tcan_16377 [Toxocara canis]